jgi:hypothetical protein
MRDLHLGYAVLEQIDALPELFKALLGLDIASAPFRANIAGHDIRLSQILLTALARQALDGRLALAPIEPDRLPAARAAIMSGGQPARLAENFRDTVRDALAARLDPALQERSAGFVNSCLNMIEEDLAELDPAEPIDPRFIRSLLIHR